MALPDLIEIVPLSSPVKAEITGREPLELLTVMVVVAVVEPRGPLAVSVYLVVAVGVT